MPPIILCHIYWSYVRKRTLWRYRRQCHQMSHWQKFAKFVFVTSKPNRNGRQRLSKRRRPPHQWPLFDLLKYTGANGASMGFYLTDTTIIYLTWKISTCESMLTSNSLLQDWSHVTNKTGQPLNHGNVLMDQMKKISEEPKVQNA